jgi:hypothetical protein
MRTRRSLLVLVLVTGATLFSWSDSSRAEDVPTLSKDDGPFLVLVRRYRGADAEVKAQTLGSELRKEHKMSAYLNRVEKNGSVVVVEVFVGNAKTMNACEKLRNSVRRIKPKCLEKERYHKDLSDALETKNPLALSK